MMLLAGRTKYYDFYAYKYIIYSLVKYRFIYLDYNKSMSNIKYINRMYMGTIHSGFIKTI